MRKPLPEATPVAAEQVLRRLEWTVLRRLDGLLQGDFRTLFRGFGLDLADLREYQYQDDVRHIDWNVTARLQAPYVREYTEDREVAAWFLLDLSPSIDFGSVVDTGRAVHAPARNANARPARELAGLVDKRLVSAEFVTVLARLLTRHGNRVGALLYGSEVDAVIPARGGRPHVLRLLHHMLQRPRLERSRGTDLSRLLAHAAQVVPRRSLLFVVSDFISTPGWEAALGRLAQRHEVVAVRLYDPLEMELPDLGLLTLQDAETGEQLFVDTHDRVFRERYAALARQREDELHAALARAGVDTLELATDDDLVAAILRFADMRRLRGRLAAGAVVGPARRASAALPAHLQALHAGATA